MICTAYEYMYYPGYEIRKYIYTFPLFQFFTAHTRADKTLALKQSLRSFHETKQSLQRVGLQKQTTKRQRYAFVYGTMNLFQIKVMKSRTVLGIKNFLISVFEKSLARPTRRMAAIDSRVGLVNKEDILGTKFLFLISV